MPLFQLTPESRKLNELARSSLEERQGDFPGRNQIKRLVKMAIPDPTDPSSYVFPVTIAKGEYLGKIAEMVKKVGRSERDFVRAGEKVPEKVLEWIDTVGTFKDLGPAFQKYEATNPGVRGAIWSKNHPNYPQRSSAWTKLGTIIGFSPERMKPDTVIHEPAHELLHHLAKAERDLVAKTYGKMTLSEWEELERLTKTSLSDPSELFTTGYTDLLLGNSVRRDFKEFPRYIRHLTKKSHKGVK